MSRLHKSFLGFFVASACAALLVACGSGTTNNSTGGSSTGLAKATISLSDPATCKGPSGPFSHVYVTIVDVKAHVSATAGDNDSGWQDLTPGLSAAPKQIDLLGQANNQCFLATLGATTQLQPGNYQQVRLILADNNTSVTNNACSGSANCVVLSDDSSVHSLALSSEAKTGIKIPAGQIASGGFNIAAGDTRDLNIDFDTCASILRQGNGQYRLKPVLHAGEVSTTATSINGRVYDKTSGQAVNGRVLVALEQKDTAGVDRIVMTTLANADGTFVFCPIPAGTYDLVVVGESNAGVAYAPSIVTGIKNGETSGTIYLSAPLAQGVDTLTYTGTITSQNASSNGTVADVQLSALSTIGGTVYTIPLQPISTQTSATLALETAVSSSCASGTDCVNYSVTLPAAGAYVGAYSTTGSTFTSSAAFGNYTLDGVAYVPSSGGTLDCNPSEVKTQMSAVTVGGLTLQVQNTMGFVQCQ